MPAFSLTNTRAMQAYQLMRAGAGIFLGIALAKSALSTGEIGIWETLLFIGTLVIFTGVNGFLQGISTVYTPLTEKERFRLVFQVFALFFVIGSGIFLLFTIFSGWVVPVLTGLPELPGLYWYALFLWLNVAVMPVEILYMLQQRPWAILWWGIASFGGQWAAVALPVLMGWGLQTGIYCLCAWAALRFVWAMRLLLYNGIPTLPDAHGRAYWRISAPLALQSFTGNLILLFDGWWVGQFFANPAVFALYRYGSREFPWASALSTALGTAAVPDIAQDTERGLALLRQRSTRLLHVVMPVSIAMVVATPWLFPLVFNKALAPAGVLFQIYLLITLSRVLLPNTVLIGLGQTRAIFYVSLCEFALKVATGVLFTQWWGLEGLAWSAVVSYWFEKIALAVFLWQKKGIAPQRWLPLRWYALYAALLLVAFVLF
jgi:O-antigen/teichoic acid export membrane protein